MNFYHNVSATAARIELASGPAPDRLDTGPTPSAVPLPTYGKGIVDLAAIGTGLRDLLN
jgi:hypothetical protein